MQTPGSPRTVGSRSKGWLEAGERVKGGAEPENSLTLFAVLLRAKSSYLAYRNKIY